MVSLRFRNVGHARHLVIGILISSDRIGDWYPERNLFQILIAITSGIVSLTSVARYAEV
jgi:hypothetical protein